MEFKMNLLESSYDYLRNSLELYKVADEYGTHDYQRSDMKNKAKWKLAFVTLVQSAELLLKAGLQKINPKLIYENSNNTNVDNKRTITFRKAITRITHAIENIFEDKDRIFLDNCVNIRNEYIHNITIVETETLKSIYCSLFRIYKETYFKLFNMQLIIDYINYQDIEYEILEYDKNGTVFRGVEINKEYLEDYKQEIIENRDYEMFISDNGLKVPRIKYGQENKIFDERGYLERVNSLFEDFDYCADCSAKKGEYHLDGCDWEVCPICFGQKLSCECHLKLIKP